MHTKRQSRVVIHHAPKDTVFGTNSFTRRTSKFYDKFAKNTLDCDIEKEVR